MTVSAAVETENMRYLTRSAKNYIFFSRTRTHTRIARARMQGYYEYVPGRNIGQIMYSTQLLYHILRMYKTLTPNSLRALLVRYHGQM